MEAAGSVQVKKESMVVVYETETGRIAHIHHEVTTRGGQHPTDAVMERTAIEHASEMAARRGVRKFKKLSVLQIDPKQFEMNVPYKVNTKRRALERLDKKK
jgi:hypothetical protein